MTNRTQSNPQIILNKLFYQTETLVQNKSVHTEGMCRIATAVYIHTRGYFTLTSHVDKPLFQKLTGI